VSVAETQAQAQAQPETETEAEPGRVAHAWRLLLEYVRPHRWKLLLGALPALTTGATGLLLPLVARGLIDDLTHDRPSTHALLGMSGLVVANASVGALGSYVLRRTAESVMLGARRALSSCLPRMRISAVERTEPGDLMARITSYPTLLRESPPTHWSASAPAD
jgi:ABC-type multidrug transport system fused ATPase/permease subunit